MRLLRGLFRWEAVVLWCSYTAALYSVDNIVVETVLCVAACFAVIDLCERERQ